MDYVYGVENRVVERFLSLDYGFDCSYSIMLLRCPSNYDLGIAEKEKASSGLNWNILV